MSWFILTVELLSSAKYSPVSICKSWLNSPSIDFISLIIRMIVYIESMHDSKAIILKEISETVSLLSSNCSFCDGSKKRISSTLRRFVLRTKPVSTSNKYVHEHFSKLITSSKSLLFGHDFVFMILDGSQRALHSKSMSIWVQINFNWRNKHLFVMLVANELDSVFL